MQSLAKHSLDLDLNDDIWFRYVHIKHKAPPHTNSTTDLKSIPAIALLSTPMELLCSLFVFATALSSFVLMEWISPLAAFSTCFALFLFVFILKRVLIFKKYGFGSRWVMSVSSDTLKVAETAKKAKVGGITEINRDDIREIIFNYTILKNRKGYGSRAWIRKTAQLHACEVHLNNGDMIELDGNRIGFFDLLYVLIFHGYPLSYRGTSAGGVTQIGLILLRLMSLSAIGCALTMLLFPLLDAIKAGL